VEPDDPPDEEPPDDPPDEEAPDDDEDDEEVSSSSPHAAVSAVDVNDTPARTTAGKSGEWRGGMAGTYPRSRPQGTIR
jgi:hypothetical protein